MNVENTRIYVKIVHSKNHYQALAKVVYFRNNMTPSFFQRWNWFFKYREALIRISNPKAYTELVYGPYQHIPEVEELKKRIDNRIVGKKAKITQFKNKIEKAKSEWRELWPIEENENYQIALVKINMLEAELESLIKQRIEIQ